MSVVVVVVYEDSKVLVMLGVKQSTSSNVALDIVFSFSSLTRQSSHLPVMPGRGDGMYSAMRLFMIE